MASLFPRRSALRKGLLYVGAVGMVLLGTPLTPVSANDVAVTNVLPINSGSGQGIVTFTPLSRPQPHMADPCVAYGNLYQQHRFFFAANKISSGGHGPDIAASPSEPIRVIFHSNDILPNGDENHFQRVRPIHPFSNEAAGEGFWYSATPPPVPGGAPGAVKLGNRMWWEFADGSHGNYTSPANPAPASGPPPPGTVWGCDADAGANPISWPADTSPPDATSSGFQISIYKGSTLVCRGTQGTYKRGAPSDPTGALAQTYVYEFPMTSTNCTFSGGTFARKITASTTQAYVNAGNGVTYSACDRPIMPAACLLNAGNVTITNT